MAVGERRLRPGGLLVLASGLWVVDVFQPVAAVLDPDTGQVRRVVSWLALPPAAPQADTWPLSCVLGDGTSLWAQQERVGPLVRINLDGVAVAVWTEGLGLAACGPGVAWCAPRPRDQELVQGAGGQPTRPLLPDRLLRVDAVGSCTTVRTEGPMRSVQADRDALLVAVDVDPWRLRDLGSELYEVVRDVRWLRLPWDATVPELLSVRSHGLPPGATPARGRDPVGRLTSRWYDAALPLAGETVTWRTGWSAADPAGSQGRRRSVASVHDGSGAVLRQWDIGDVTVTAATAVGHRLVLSAAREPRSPYPGRDHVELLALDPDQPQPVVLLLPDTVDISSHCWPLIPRPLDADSYSRRVLAANSSVGTYWRRHDGTGLPLADGLSDAHAELTGDWPDTQLEWTFTHRRYPGLRLRRQVALYDELGRVANPEHAAIHLMENLDTHAVPRTETASEGVLDV